jgi:hypothetical protein
MIVLTDFSHAGGVPLNPQREPVAGDVVQITQGGAIIEQRYAPPPPPSPPAPPQVTLSKADFLRRFTSSEIAAFNRKRKEVQALAPAEYSDPTKAALVALEGFLVLFDAVSELRLWHADTAAGLDVLTANGIIAIGRKAQILDATA